MSVGSFVMQSFRFPEVPERSPTPRLAGRHQASTRPYVWRNSPEGRIPPSILPWKLKKPLRPAAGAIAVGACVWARRLMARPLEGRALSWVRSRKGEL
jgi:hypothetical protein